MAGLMLINEEKAIRQIINEHLPYESDASQDLVQAAIGHYAERSLVGLQLGKYRGAESAQPVREQFARQT